jgi:hypothetical protein
MPERNKKESVATISVVTDYFFVRIAIFHASADIDGCFSDIIFALVRTIRCFGSIDGCFGDIISALFSTV